MANKNDATLQTTKQMLDELDALMEKMLSLPVNETDETPPFPHEVKAPILTPTLSATLTLLEAPPKPAPVVVEPIAHPTINPPHVALPPQAVPEPAPPPAPLTNEVVPPSVLSNLEPLLADIPEPETPVTTAWVYLPLLWINLAFDGIVRVLFGGVGEWLGSQAGRAVLGVSGVALILAATGWFLKDWLGWN